MKNLIMIVLLLLSIQVAIADEIRMFNYKDVTIRLHDDSMDWPDIKQLLDRFPAYAYTELRQIDFKLRDTCGRQSINYHVVDNGGRYDQAKSIMICQIDKTTLS